MHGLISHILQGGRLYMRTGVNLGGVKVKKKAQNQTGHLGMRIQSAKWRLRRAFKIWQKGICHRGGVMAAS